MTTAPSAVPLRRLYHYTCHHAAVHIGRDGVLRPHIHPVAGVSLVWLTGNPAPRYRDLGLYVAWKRCNHVEVCVVVSGGPDIVPWPSWADHAVRNRALSEYLRELIELDAAPEHWWVSEKPVSVMSIHQGATHAHTG